MDAIEIGNRLRELRERSGLSAKEVSEILMEKYQIDLFIKKKILDYMIILFQILVLKMKIILLTKKRK